MHGSFTGGPGDTGSARPRRDGHDPMRHERHITAQKETPPGEIKCPPEIAGGLPADTLPVIIRRPAAVEVFSEN